MKSKLFLLHLQIVLTPQPVVVEPRCYTKQTEIQLF